MKIINLLPKPRQQELRFENIYRGIVRTIFVSLASFVLVFVAQAGTKVYLTAEKNSLEQQTQKVQQQINSNNNEDLKIKIETINNLATDYLNLAAGSPAWSKVLQAFAIIPPPGVQILSFQLDPVSRQVMITGFSPTRDLVIQLRTNLVNDTQDFSNVDYPLENIARPTNINFHYTFTVNESLLQ